MTSESVSKYGEAYPVLHLGNDIAESSDAVIRNIFQRISEDESARDFFDAYAKDIKILTEGHVPQKEAVHFAVQCLLQNVINAASMLGPTQNVRDLGIQNLKLVPKVLMGVREMVGAPAIKADDDIHLNLHVYPLLVDARDIFRYSDMQKPELASLVLEGMAHMHRAMFSGRNARRIATDDHVYTSMYVQNLVEAYVQLRKSYPEATSSVS